MDRISGKDNLESEEMAFDLENDIDMSDGMSIASLPNPMLGIREVSKTFLSSRKKNTLALDRINLDVYPNEMVCLIGESGCGKSTLLQLVAGFEMPTSGKIFVHDQEISGPDHKRGVVFQEQSLLPWLSVEKNIRLGLDIRGVHADVHERLKQLIEVMGLTGFEHFYPGQLSGGMAQRVAIARAIINNPDILLLDEPFGALDAFTRMKLQDELLRIKAQTDLTSVFVTHDIDEAVYLGDRIIVLTPRPGRIARIYSIPLEHPRDRTSPEFIRLRGMIAKEFMLLSREDREPENVRTTEEPE
jgi:NitT/TauT family transport system ATP-binding protein/sulfonate transport system ATP-binding protein